MYNCQVCSQQIKTFNSKCKNCGFTWMGNERGNESYDYENNYDENSDYNRIKPEAVLNHYKNAPNTGWALTELRRMFLTGISKTLIEVGASQGAFLYLTKEIGYQVQGYEIASKSVEYGHNNFGLVDSLKKEFLQENNDPKNCVDVVCAFEVLEHTENPFEFIQICRSWLKPNGTLFLSVPNGERLAVRLGKREKQDQPPHHLMSWTKKSMELFLSIENFYKPIVFTSKITHSDIFTMLLPSIAAKRASELGSLRAVSVNQTESTLNDSLKDSGSMLNSALFKKCILLLISFINLVPKLGTRLVVKTQKTGSIKQ